MSVFNNREARFAAIEELSKTKILVLDGAMGSLIQGLGFKEDDFRGTHFSNHDMPLQGNHDVLSITQPKLFKNCTKIISRQA